jgi:hypothetical protein
VPALILCLPGFYVCPDLMPTLFHIAGIVKGAHMGAPLRKIMASAI